MSVSRPASRRHGRFGRPGRLGRLLLGADPIRRSIYVLGLLPAVWTFWLGLAGQLGADPQNTLERTLGLWALRFLVVGLAITPLRRLGGPSLVRWRRAIGLMAFYYACMHLSVYLLLDKSLDVSAIWADIVRRPYITVGLLAFTILVPLAITSNGTMIRRLGARAWQRLHRLVYVAAAAAALHFVMLVKVWWGEPIVYAGLIAALLLHRIGLALHRRSMASAPSQRPARRTATESRGV
jgi:methionine sulfoxide reductase heme-binding subunit